MNKLDPVTLIAIHWESEVATIDRGHGKLGVNLWELCGFARRADGFTRWRFEATNFDFVDITAQEKAARALEALKAGANWTAVAALQEIG